MPVHTHTCTHTRTHAHTRTEFVSSSFLGRMLGEVSFLFRRSHSLTWFHPVTALLCQSGLRVCCIHSRSTFLSHGSHLLISLESIALRIYVRVSAIRRRSEWDERITCTGELSIALHVWGSPLTGVHWRLIGHRLTVSLPIKTRSAPGFVSKPWALSGLDRPPTPCLWNGKIKWWPFRSSLSFYGPKGTR